MSPGRSHRRVKVLHVADRFVGLTENWIYPQVTAVPQTDVAVLANTRANQRQYPFNPSRTFLNYPVWLTKFRGARGADRIARILRTRARAERAAKRWSPNVLHAHFGPIGYQYLNLARQCDATLITSFYGYDAWLFPERDPIWRDRYKELFGAGDTFLVEGPAMRQRLVSLGCSEEKIVIHRLGVDCDGLEFRTRDFNPPLQIIMVGSFVAKKGLPNGLMACAGAARSGIDLAVTIVGDAPDRREESLAIKQSLHEIAATKELQGRVRFTGYIPLDQTTAMLAEHDVMLTPSKKSADGDAEGGSPVVLTQAMAMGLICIGTRHCDIPEVIVDQVTGYLCDEGNTMQMSAAIAEIAEEPSRANWLAVNGRMRIEEKFDLHSQLQSQAEVYMRLSSQHEEIQYVCGS